MDDWAQGPPWLSHSNGWEVTSTQLNVLRFFISVLKSLILRRKHLIGLIWGAREGRLLIMVTTD